jgi:hypothetical protein
LIEIKTTLSSFEQYRCCTRSERIMQMDVILAAGMTAAFAFFAVTLFWAEFQTRHLGDQR